MENLQPIPARGYPAQPKVTAGGKTAVAVLSDTDFEPTPHLAFTEDLARRLNLDLSSTLAVMKSLPLWHTGENHIALRRDVADFLAKSHKKKCHLVSEHIRPVLHRHFNGPEVDLLAAIRDVVHIFMEEITGLPLIGVDTEDMPSIFSSNLGIRARKRLEAIIRSQIEFARQRFPEENESHRLMRVGQWTMGRDALVGTLSISLYHHLEGLAGQALSTTRLPTTPTHTGVPAIGRIALKDRLVTGCPVSKGDLIECRLDMLSKQTENDRRHFFGAGAHLCLGRPLSLSLMGLISDALFEFDFGLATSAFYLAENDVFDIPAVFKARKINSQDGEVTQ